MQFLVEALKGPNRIALHELWADREIKFDASLRELELQPGEALIEVIVSQYVDIGKALR